MGITPFFALFLFCEWVHLTREMKEEAVTTLKKKNKVASNWILLSLSWCSWRLRCLLERGATHHLWRRSSQYFIAHYESVTVVWVDWFSVTVELRNSSDDAQKSTGILRGNPEKLRVRVTFNLAVFFPLKWRTQLDTWGVVLVATTTKRKKKQKRNQRQPMKHIY